MVRTLLIIFSIALLGSCSPCLYMAKHCPAEIKDSTYVNRIDSINRIEVRDTIPADTLHDTIKVPCKDFEYHKENKRQKVYIKVKDGNLEYEAVCKEWEFKYFVTNTVSILTEKSFHSEKRTAIVKEKRNKNWWGWLSYWQSWVCIGIFALWITIKILRMTGNFPIQIKRSG